MRLPVLVTLVLAEEHHVAIVVQPNKRGTEIAIGGPRERSRRIGIVDRPHPKVQHAVDWRKKGDTPSVRTDANKEFARVAKQKLAWNEHRSPLVGHKLCLPKSR